MDYPEQYQTQILNAIHRIDLDKVAKAIQIFKSARAHGQRIFVCGSGGADAVAAQMLCDVVKSASSNRASRFRILALSDHLPAFSVARGELNHERIFVEQLKNFAEPEDVVAAICTTGDAPAVINALEYACWIGCRTIAITGPEGGDVGRTAELAIEVAAAHPGAVEDVHMVICHMIGYYFIDSEQPSVQGA